VSGIVRWLSAFEFGAFRPLSVRRERVDLGLGRPVRLLYASDLHLGHWWTQGVPDHLLAACREERPDFVLLGGDLADRRAALDRLCDCVRALADVAPVLAVPGNHDERTGLAGIRNAVEAGGGRWLPTQPMTGPLGIDGQLAPVPGAGPRLLCAHYPGIFPAAVRAGYGLVLAGHLHGGQCVLATVGGRLYPAVWLHRWHGLRFAEAGATMLVSRGAADTFPFRFNCPREVILCEIG
jgi:predicted MPP superfamily phosphohydrolase